MATTIRIGHASISESGSINGTAGDSTGKEVYIAEDYDVTKKGYTILLRPKTAIVAEKSAAACEAACKNDKIGYSQFGLFGRQTLYKEAEKVDFDLAKIETACNTDCSAFMSVCANAAGVKISAGVTTVTMAEAFVNSTFYDKITDTKYFTGSDYLQRGDILVKAGSHTIMILDNGSKIPTSVYSNRAIRDTSWVQNFFAIKIAVNITNIETKKMSALINVVQVENGEEEVLDNSSKINLYDWFYEIKSLTTAGAKPYSKTFSIKPGKTTFNLTTLLPNNSYILTITAKEKSGEAEFHSPNVIFTTAKRFKLDEDSSTEFVSKISSTKNCKTFVKIGNSFKRAILYNRREV